MEDDISGEPGWLRGNPPMSATWFSGTSTHDAGGPGGGPCGCGGAGAGDGGMALIVVTGMDLTSIGGCILG
jgi:hypothetical protein